MSDIAPTPLDYAKLIIGVSNINEEHSSCSSSSDGLDYEMSSSSSDDDSSEEDEDEPKERQARPGSKVRTNWSRSPWGLMLLDDSHKDPDSRAGKYFRRRFRVPYLIYARILDMCREAKLFNEHYYNSCPLELKILSTLRMLGRGGTFDDCFDGSGMSEETIRTFFLKFVRTFAYQFYHEFVHPPKTADEFAHVLSVYNAMGLPGCIGGIDCTHVRLGKCPFNMRSSCKGKEPFPTLAYEATVSHTKEVHHLTNHHVGTRNDKTIVHFDSHVVAVKEEDLYKSMDFEVYVDELGNKETISGVYLICDGGYHRWRILQCPLKHSVEHEVNEFCAMLESIRKDVECFFGILKIRFRFIDGKIEIHLFEDIDNVMYTCCILHNMLLKHDGFSDMWKHLVECGDPDTDFHEVFDRPAHLDVINARARAKTAAAEPDLEEQDPMEVIHEGGWQTLHEKLVKHFVIAKRRGEVRWLA
jgi:hypothetical protein